MQVMTVRMERMQWVQVVSVVVWVQRVVQGMVRIVDRMERVVEGMVRVNRSMVGMKQRVQWMMPVQQVMTDVRVVGVLAAGSAFRLLREHRRLHRGFRQLGAALPHLLLRTRHRRRLDAILLGFLGAAKLKPRRSETSDEQRQKQPP